MDIILMRAAETSSDRYCDVLESFGRVSCIPVLSNQFVNEEDLKLHITNSAAWAGIVFTSKRGVDAVSLCCDEISLSSWKSKPCYVVGEATNRAAEKLGFSCVGKDSGNAENLAHCIVKDNESSPFEHPLIFVCGQLKREVLPDILFQNGIACKELVSYEVTPDPQLTKQIRAIMTDRSIPSHIVFFSPSGYNFSSSIWKEVLGDSILKVQMVAIGPTTAEVLRKDGYSVKVAEKPNPHHLAQAIKNKM